MSEPEPGSSSSLGGAQSPEDAAEALRVFGEQQHSHPDVLQNLEDGESDDDDSDEDLSSGLNMHYVLGYRYFVYQETLYTLLYWNGKIYKSYKVTVRYRLFGQNENFGGPS